MKKPQLPVINTNKKLITTKSIKNNPSFLITLEHDKKHLRVIKWINLMSKNEIIKSFENAINKDALMKLNLKQLKELNKRLDKINDQLKNI